MLGEIFSDEIVVLQEEIRIKEAQVSSLQGAELSVIDAMAALSSAIATATEIAPLAIEKLKKSVMSLWDNDPNDRAPDDGNQDSNSHPENSGNGNQDSDSHPENNGNSNQDSNSHPENSGNSNQDSNSHPENSGNTENSFLTEKQANLTYCGDNRIGQVYSSDGEIQFSICCWIPITRTKLRYSLQARNQNLGVKKHPNTVLDQSEQTASIP
ncbi:MAG: hypothetical protein JGK28_06380 [Microcoleus sp. PH2017_07_MST_O_A]|nr:hypothetical protein [Microcoleus sp. PH2017_07_MST_O_A]